MRSVKPLMKHICEAHDRKWPPRIPTELITNYECDQCEAVFQSKPEMKNHLDSCTKESIKQPPELPLEEPPEQAPEQPPEETKNEPLQEASEKTPKQPPEEQPPAKKPKFI